MIKNQKIQEKKGTPRLSPKTNITFNGERLNPFSKINKKI